MPNPSPTSHSSVQFSHSVASDSFQPHGLQHARPPCPSSTLAVFSSVKWSNWNKSFRLFTILEFVRIYNTLSSVQSLSCVPLFETPGLQHARLPCPSPTPRVYSNSCPLSWWCHPTISSSVIPFSSCLQSFPASGSFPMHQFFSSSGQSIGVSASASVLPMNIQDWFLLGWTGWISL